MTHTVTGRDTATGHNAVTVATHTAGHHERARRPGTLTVLRWEVAKLAAQARARYLLLGCLIVPPVIVAVFTGQQPPSDTIYGRHIHESGLADALLILAFAHQWLLPLLASLVAGDIFANEDGHGTWKTILTRSASRGQIFAAKTLTAAGFNLLALLVLAASTIAGSLLIVGAQPLPGLSGQLIPARTALPLVAAAWATAIAPLLGFTALALLLSVLSRNPTAGVAAPVVLGFAMQLLSTLGGLDLARRLLLTTGFEAWHGLFTQQRFTGPIAQAGAVAAGWAVVCLLIGYLALRRRDVIGG
ncbi:ABC transporter permease [Dactylosporangium sp. CA-152071]|uniref:ABC transporter permease n=1 Tax=Dactylosporangium sp. CA-152071 TaxID=3239933 RepID=UPI003D906C09